MAETALREKWTDWSLDDLNRGVDRKLQDLHEGARRIRTDIKRLESEMDDTFDDFIGKRPKGDRCRQSVDRLSPELETKLQAGGSWTDGRIHDLRRTVDDGLTGLDGDVKGLRDEAQDLRSELTIRFAYLDRRRRLFRRGGYHQPARQQHPRMWPCVAAVEPLRGRWTDGRLDDFNHRTDAGFAHLECDMKEVQSEVEGLKSEMTEGFRELRSARSKRESRLFLATFYGAIVAAGLIDVLFP